MTDREMLELAAKAAGIEHLGGEYCVSGSELWDIDGKKWWKPLANDGDALRLAVQLNIDIEISDCGADTWAFDNEGYIVVHVFESANHCKLSATRRAIVRAAAEIGAQM